MHKVGMSAHKCQAVVVGINNGSGNGSYHHLSFAMALMLQTVVLEKTLESPLGSKETKPVNSKVNLP